MRKGLAVFFLVLLLSTSIAHDGAHEEGEGHEKESYIEKMDNPVLSIIIVVVTTALLVATGYAFSFEPEEST